MEDQKPYTVPHPGRQDCIWERYNKLIEDGKIHPKGYGRPLIYGNPHTEIQPERCELPKTKIIKVRKFVTLHIYDPIPNNSDGIVIMCWNDPKNSDGLCLTGKWMDFEFEIPMDGSDQCDNCGRTVDMAWKDCHWCGHCLRCG